MEVSEGITEPAERQLMYEVWGSLYTSAVRLASDFQIFN